MSVPDAHRRALLFGLSGLLGACATATPASVLEPLQGFPTAPVGPALPTGPLQSIAITSCSDETRAAPLYSDISASKPDLVLMLGDNVYGSSTPEDPELSDLRAAYWQMSRRDEFKTLIQATPIMAVWDDHDFGKNDAGGDFSHKRLAQAMFNKFWNIPADSPLRSRPGIYRHMRIGPTGQRVQIIMLDTRYFRDPLKITDQRGAPGRERYVPHAVGSNLDILGAAQWTWLEGVLKEPADLRIIASSIQVVADGHGYERWGQFPDAQARLYRLIETTGAKGVVFVSGDRHLGVINKRPAQGSYPLYDLTASAINTSNWSEGRPTDNGEASSFKVTPSYTPANYGMINIDWAGRALRLKLIGINKAPILDTRVSFSEIGL